MACFYTFKQERYGVQRFGLLIFLTAILVSTLRAQDGQGVASDTVKVKKQDTASVLESQDEPNIFVFVDEMPTFPGGEAAMQRYIANNIDYPDSAVENGVQGKVIVQFTIDEMGNLIGVHVINEVHPLLAAEAIRVIRRMPKWKPGRQKGKAVKVRFTVPIRFQLE